MLQFSPEEFREPDPLQGLHAAEHRRELLVHNRERIEFAYQKALADGVEDPVILVLDLQDESAARLAELTGLSHDKLMRWREQCEQQDVVPTQILVAPRWAVLCVVGPLTPHGPQGVAKPNPPHTFRVVAVAAGGSAYADFPEPPVCIDPERN